MREQAIWMVCAAAWLAMVGCGKSAAEQEAAMKRAVELSAAVTSLGIEDAKVGDGEVATPGRRVRVHYTGTLMEGTEFDSSKGGEPYAFVLGQREVIAGWDEGIKGMKVGGKRRLTIPARMAYGSRSPGPGIPPNAALKFDVELVGVE